VNFDGRQEPFVPWGGFAFGSPRRVRVTSESMEAKMNGLIYLIGLIVVIMAILSFFGLR
jgi:hypothetical protein